jgi:Domain of unknown function (DUF4351)
MMSSETSPAYLDSFDKLAQQGIQLGLERGRFLGQQDLILSQLKHKLGKVRLKSIVKIINLPVERLGVLGVDLLGFDNTADLEQWLDL